MQIAIDGKRFFLNASGLGRYSRTLIHYLLNQTIDPSLRISLFKPKGRTAFSAPSHPNLTVISPDYPLPGDLGNGLWRFFTLPRLLEDKKFSLFHGPSHIIPFGAKCPTVVTMFDLIFLRFPEYFKRWDRSYYGYAFKKSAEKADHIIAFSKATRLDLMTYFKIPFEKMSVIYPAFDNEFSPIDEMKCERIKKEYQLPNRYILYVGTIEPRKNILKTAQAFDRLMTQKRVDPETRFLIVGSKGWFYKDILEGIARLKSNKNIRLMGPVFGEDLAGIYQMATVMAYPSLFEGFGYPVLESMRLGTAVLTSNISSLPEAGGDAAHLIDPNDIDAIADGLFQLLSNKSYRQELVQKGYAHAAGFTAEKMVKETLSVYQKVAR